MPLKGPFTQIEGPKCTLNELIEGDEQHLDTGPRGTTLGDEDEVNLVGDKGPDEVILGEDDKGVETGPSCRFKLGEKEIWLRLAENNCHRVFLSIQTFSTRHPVTNLTKLE